MEETKECKRKPPGQFTEICKAKLANYSDHCLCYLFFHLFLVQLDAEASISNVIHQPWEVNAF